MITISTRDYTKISIHALRVEGDFRACSSSGTPFLISIHALRVEGDLAFIVSMCAKPISIHALRVEGDAVKAGGTGLRSRNFYPRPPGGGRRHYGCKYGSARADFYPRPPGGGRHDALPRLLPVARISIHALRVEGDLETEG